MAVVGVEYTNFRAFNLILVKNLLQNGGKSTRDRMEYFRIKEKEQEVFVNLCNVLWVAFSDRHHTITFNRCQNDALSITVPKDEYENTKEKLMKVLVSSTRVVLD